jgi:hypothetical protein
VLSRSKHNSRFTVLKEKLGSQRQFLAQTSVNSLGLVVAFCCVCRVVFNSRDLAVPRYGSCGILDNRIAIIDKVHCLGAQCSAGGRRETSMPGVSDENNNPSDYKIYHTRLIAQKPPWRHASQLEASECSQKSN